MTALGVPCCLLPCCETPAAVFSWHAWVAWGSVEPLSWQLHGDKCGILKILLVCFSKEKGFAGGDGSGSRVIGVSKGSRAPGHVPAAGSRCGFPAGAMPRSHPCMPVPRVRSIAENPLELGALGCRRGRCLRVGSARRAGSGGALFSAAPPRLQPRGGSTGCVQFLLRAGLWRSRREQKAQKHLSCLPLAMTPLS